MKGMTARSALVLLACGAALIAAQCPVLGEECMAPPAGSVYRIFKHNAGIYPGCIQDYDMDEPEYDAFIANFSDFTAPAGWAVIGDGFDVNCNDPSHPDRHADVVEAYFMYSNDGHQPFHENLSVGWVTMVNNIAEDPRYRRSVANLSNGPLPPWKPDKTAVVLNAYNHEILLIGAPLTFAGGPNSIKDKVLTCIPMDSRGEMCSSHVPDVNAAEVLVPTNWYDSSTDEVWITEPLGGYLTNGYELEGQSGSFSTGLLSGAVQRIADAVVARNVPEGQFVSTVLDYVISACDRNRDPETYEIVPPVPGQPMSYGPWSPIWGYGVFSAWKTLIYAYGWGTLQPKDEELNPGEVTNPSTVFSDEFALRGDLFVPAGETFEVSPLATILVADLASPEGPTSLGLIPELCEIHVSGTMANRGPLVNASITIDDGGVCTVESGGLVKISAGQVLHVYPGGELNLETGGEIMVEADGQFIIEGEFNHSGEIAMLPGAQMICEPGSRVYLATDLTLPLCATFSAGPNVIITAALSDVRGIGSDPSRVEINFQGAVNLSGTSDFPVTFKAQTAGAGKWVGIYFNSSEEVLSSAWSNVLISDAITGIAVTGGTNPLDLSFFKVKNCTTGVKIQNRNDVPLSDGEVWSCMDGVRCENADIVINALSVHHNSVGIKCGSNSDPTVRWCTVYSNTNGVATVDAYSTPDLGTTADPGNNVFPFRPGNTYNVCALDPSTDIYAQNNWWGTTSVSAIQSKLIVICGDPGNCGSIVFQPFLEGAPMGALARRGPEEASEVPASTYLAQNHPNPFNPVTTIGIGLSEPSNVVLQIYDVSGRLVRTLVDELLGAGPHEKVWDGRDSAGTSVASGVYFYRLTIGDKTLSKKMLLLK